RRGVGLDAGHRAVGADERREYPGEQARAAVQVEDHVARRGGQGRGHRLAQRLGGGRVDLPEAVGADLPEAPRGALGQVLPALDEDAPGPGGAAAPPVPAALRRLAALALAPVLGGTVLDDGHREVLRAFRAAGRDLDHGRAGPLVAGDVQVAHRLVGDEAVPDVDHPVRAVLAQAGRAVAADRVLDARAPAEPRRGARGAGFSAGFSTG